MAALHFHQGRPAHSSRAHRLHYLATQGCWDEPEAFGLAAGIIMTSIGVILLAGFVGAEFMDAALAGILLVFLGSPFLVFGVLLLLILCAETAWRRLRRIQRHCGRCRFYQALDGQYALGRCRADPREAEVHRTNSCPFFSYSERAMVRDRFARRAEALARARRQESKQYLTKKRGMIHQSQS